MKCSILVSVVSVLVASVMARVACAADRPGNTLAPPSDYKHVKPGLWEETINAEVPTAPRIPAGAMDLSSLSPEQRARVEGVLKRQAEQAAAQGNAPRLTTRTRQFCVRQADLDGGKDSLFRDKAPGKDDNCTTRETARSASRVSLKAECMVKDVKMTNDFTYEIRSPTEIAGSMSSSGSYDGQPLHSSETVTAHWMGTDCGKVN